MHSSLVEHLYEINYRMLDQSNLSVQRCRLIFWVECSVGGYLALAKTIQADSRSPFIRNFLISQNHIK
jgi:hypothetical protein